MKSNSVKIRNKNLTGLPFCGRQINIIFQKLQVCVSDRTLNLQEERLDDLRRAHEKILGMY